MRLTVGPELIPGSLHADNPWVTTRYNPLAKPGGVDDQYSPPVQLLLSSRRASPPFGRYQIILFGDKRYMGNRQNLLLVTEAQPTTGT